MHACTHVCMHMESMELMQSKESTERTRSSKLKASISHGLRNVGLRHVMFARLQGVLSTVLYERVAKYFDKLRACKAIGAMAVRSFESMTSMESSARLVSME